MHLSKRIILLISGFIGLLLVCTGGLLLAKRTANAPESSVPANQTTNQQPAQPSPSAASFNKNQHSTDDPSSIWMIVNKKHPLPNTYAPTTTTVGGKQLRKEAAAAMTSLLSEASKAGAGMSVISGYRSYANQQTVYSQYVQRDGQAAADRYSARPGFSEHQTGLAADLGATSGSCALEICFADTTQGKWLAAHAHEYGFIIRYQDGAESRTGYQYEPWHVRYVGTDLAGEIYKSGQTLEEFFGLAAASDY